MGKPDDEDDATLRARLESLSTALGARKPSTEATPNAAGADAQRARSMSVGMRVMSEFVGAVLVGAFLGWACDKWLGTGPWGLVVFLFLGLAAAFWNVYRIATTPSENDARK